MSAKTKIVVLHMKKIILAGIATGIALLLLLFLFIFSATSRNRSDEETVDTMYTPGVYTSSVTIDGNPIDVEVSVDSDHINAVSLVHLDSSVETLYPLLRPALDSLAEQIIANQSIDNLSYSKNNQYTCQLLVDAVSSALDKAKASHE